MPRTAQKDSVFERMLSGAGDDWLFTDDPLDRRSLSNAFARTTLATRRALDPTPLDDETALMERSFAAFCKGALPVFVPNEIIWSWPHDAVCEHLQAVTSGEIRNLIVNMPPRNLKSSIVSVCWNAWEWIRNPRLRYLFTSYGMKLSQRDNDYTRQLIRSRWYQERWGDRYSIRKEQDAKGLFENTMGGRRLASSVTSGNTGEGGERIVVDDPHNALEADSELAREEVLTWWTRVMASRVNSARAAKVVIAQRVHHADLVGSLVEMMQQGGERYERLIIPMEYDPKLYVEVEIDLEDEDEDDWLDDLPSEEPDAPSPLTILDADDRPTALIPRVTSLGWSDPRKKPGELMIPEQWPPDWVAQQKVILGPYAWSAQYQEAPSPSEGGRFKEHYWQRYEYTPMFHRGLRPEITVVDSAYGEEGSDPTGISVWGKMGGRLYVMWACELQEDTPGLRRKLRDIHAKWNVPFLIEDKANGKALIQDLRRGGDDDRLPSLPVIPFTPDGLDKISRAHSVVNYVAGGMVYLPENAEWVFDFIQQHKMFPTGAHDDLVDTTSMAITWLAKRANSIGELVHRVDAPYGENMTNSMAPTSNRDGYWS